jgi:hypothetical protein
VSAFYPSPNREWSLLPRSDALTLTMLRSPTCELQTVQEALSACQLSPNSGQHSGQNTQSSGDVLGHNSDTRTYSGTQWSKIMYQSAGGHYPTALTAYTSRQAGLGTGATSQSCHVTLSVSTTISSKSMLTSDVHRIFYYNIRHTHYQPKVVICYFAVPLRNTNSNGCRCGSEEK